MLGAGTAVNRGPSQRVWPARPERKLDAIRNPMGEKSLTGQLLFPLLGNDGC